MRLALMTLSLLSASSAFAIGYESSLHGIRVDGYDQYVARQALAQSQSCEDALKSQALKRGFQIKDSKVVSAEITLTKALLTNGVVCECNWAEQSVLCK